MILNLLAALAAAALVAAYVGAWRIYRSAWDRTATAAPAPSLARLWRRRRRMRGRLAAQFRSAQASPRGIAEA